MLNGDGNLPKHLSSLQYLRAIAAMSVVYFHAVIQIEHSSVVGLYPKVGAVGVDIFFVLSGFVMWMTTAGKHNTPLQFMKRRIVRIVPLYWLVTLAAAACTLVIPHLLRSTKFDAAHVVASLFFIPWRNPAATPTSSELFFPVIVPGWTLNMEMMFYVLFAVCLLLKRELRPVVLGVLIAIVFAVGAASSPYESELSFYGSTRVFEFFSGVALAAYMVPLLRFNPRIALGLTAIAFVVMLIAEGQGWPVFQVFKFGIPSFIMVACCVNIERVATVPKWRVLEALGDASYSIYLTHVFALALMRIVLQGLGIPMTDFVAYIFVPAGTVFSAVVGWLAHKYIEKPLVRVVNGVLREGKTPPDRAVLR